MKSWAWAGAVLLVGAGAFTGGACSSGGSGGGNVGGSGGSSGTHMQTSTGTHSSPTSTTGTGGNSMGCGSLGLQPQACQDCGTTNCCSELKNCDTNSDCQSYIACVQQAQGNGTDPSVCDTMFPAGKTASDALNTCLNSNCATECSAGGVCDAGITFMDPQCDTCLGTNCCTQFEAVGAEGQMGLTDYNACTTDPTCMGDTAAQGAFQCFNSMCPQDCGAPICNSGFTDKAPAACINCLGDANNGCCDAFTACHADQQCSDCITGMTMTGCDTNQNVAAVNNCFMTTCGTECGAGGSGP